MQIGSVIIAPGQPCRLVAELSNAHNGDLDRALRIIDGAAEAGADLVKFQCYTPDELVALRGQGSAPEPWGSQGLTMRDLYEKAQTPLSWFPVLAEHCKAKGIPWFSSVFGPASLTLLEAFGCPAYKLAALEWGKRSLLNMVRKIGKPVIRSCPHAEPPRSEETILYCPPGYPQQDFTVWNVRGFDGFSYHGKDPLIPFLAAVIGAQLVEVHVELDAEPSELETANCLTISSLAQLVDMLERTEEVRGA